MESKKCFGVDLFKHLWANKSIFNWGKRYLITFIDDYTRKTWVYFLQEKSEAFSAFKSFKARVENEAERVIKLFALIVEENIAQRNLMLFVMSMVFEGNLQLPTHHNKMVYQRGKIEPSSTW